MAIPIALEDFGWVVSPLHPQELDHARVAGLDLVPIRPAVIGEEIAAAKFNGAVDQAAEIIGRLGDPSGV